MKKIIISIFTIFLLVICFSKSANVNAANFSINEELVLVSQETIYLSDGSFIEKSVYSAISLANDSISTFAVNETYTKTGLCIVTKYNTSNSILWEYTLTGYFTVTTGVSCVCTGATYSKYINSSSWTFSEGNTNYSGNYAYGQGKFTYKLLFVVLQNVILDVWVSCDVYGNIS